MARLIVRNPFEKRVDFTSNEIELLRDLASKRQVPKDANRLVCADKRIIIRDNVETHLLGLMGEYALSKLIFGPVDTNAYLCGDTEKDFELYGVSIEVKTLQGYLAFQRLSDFVADVAVLAIYEKGNYSSAWVQGWITRKEFQSEHFTDDFGYGQRPCMQPAQLLPIDTLKAHCLMTRNLRWVVRQNGLNSTAYVETQP